jgi:protein-S-isoprenylcysteine O-methyltransferase Ste14
VRADTVGAWLFRNRGWLPVPLLLAMLTGTPRFWGPGLMLIGVGEGVRLWAVGHIGLPSRTRGADVGDLVDTGPYARVRNPLYVGNVLLFAGLGVIVWPWALVATPLLLLHYHLIVRWEEGNLGRRLGGAYADYVRRVPRWLPLGPGRAGGWDPRRALRSERTTLLVVGGVLGILILRGPAL